MTSLDVCKMKVYCSQKKGVKVDRFLKIVWTISNLSKCLIYKIRNFLTSGFEIYAIWLECLVNKLSQIPDVNTLRLHYNAVLYNADSIRTRSLRGSQIFFQYTMCENASRRSWYTQCKL